MDRIQRSEMMRQQSRHHIMYHCITFNVVKEVTVTQNPNDRHVIPRSQ